MCAKRVEDLIIWQLADQLKADVYELTETGPAAKDWKFRDQLRDAAGSVTRNMSEGFGRYRHKQFAVYLRYSRGSLFETTDCLRDGVTRKYWASSTIQALLILAKRATKGTTKFIRYLETNPDEPYWE